MYSMLKPLTVIPQTEGGIFGSLHLLSNMYCNVVIEPARSYNQTDSFAGNGRMVYGTHRRDAFFAVNISLRRPKRDAQTNGRFFPTHLFFRHLDDFLHHRLSRVLRGPSCRFCPHSVAQAALV